MLMPVCAKCLARKRWQRRGFERTLNFEGFAHGLHRIDREAECRLIGNARARRLPGIPDAWSGAAHSCFGGSLKAPSRRIGVRHCVTVVGIVAPHFALFSLRWFVDHLRFLPRGVALLATKRVSPRGLQQPSPARCTMRDTTVGQVELGDMAGRTNRTAVCVGHR